METKAPTIGRILVAVGFAISCFAIALFLWLAFGGPIPLQPEGYRFKASFDEATQLSVESDVRISGVSVGTVKRVDLDSEGRAEATIELEGRYAPIPADTRGTLRQKTLLGETYVELTPGSEEAGMLEEGGTLPVTQISDMVQLDEIFRTFDPRTRAAFQAWMQGQAAALRGRGEDLSVAIASLEPFAAEATRILRVLDTQDRAVRRLVRGGGEVFGALSERRGQLRGLIENAATVFDTTARRNDELAAAFVAFPTFLRESRATLARLERFAADTDPLVTQLRPAARELGPTLNDLGDLARELEGFWPGLERAANRAPAGSQALQRLLGNNLPPLLGRLDDFLPELNPIVEGLRIYRREVTAFLGNVAAATNMGLDLDVTTGLQGRALRTEGYLGPEALASFPNRLRVNRTNPYMRQGDALRIRSGWRSFETRHCAAGIRALLDPTTPMDPDFIDRVELPGDTPVEAQARAEDFFERIRTHAFGGTNDSNNIPRPGCVEQPAFRSIGQPSELTDYLHVWPLP
ncbi:MAG TPA: MlaD family protein [Solirubrobacterales bacterium]|nr:MlaD family protein [Solirubrobacterales bacterium]